jgi:hypothetical protein
VKDWQLNGTFLANAGLNLVHFLGLAGQHQTKFVAEIVFEVNQAGIWIDMFSTYKLSPEIFLANTIL